MFLVFAIFARVQGFQRQVLKFCMNMIEKVRIANFKSIVELELELGRLNVFIGENGCGKTNILEAITCSSIAGETGGILSDTLASLRGVRVTNPTLMPPLFNKTFSQKATLIALSSNNNEKAIVEIIDYDKTSWFLEYSVEGLLLEQLKKVEGRTWKKQNEFTPYLSKIFGNNVAENFYNYAPENYFLRRFEEEGQVKPLGIRGEGLFKHLVDIYRKKPELLKKIGEKLRLIGWFQGFEIPKDLMFTERRINIKDKYLQELDYFDQRSANEGFLYLLFYFTLFISPFTPKFFSIDNIDNSLNPKLCAELVRQLAQMAKENDKQAILTTHNPAVLDGLDLNDDAQRLFTIYRNAEGHTIAKRIMPAKKIEGVESVRLSEAFIRGYLGGLPKNF